MSVNDYFNECDFTFEDEVNLSRKIYGKRKKKYCDTFRIKLHNKIKEIQCLKNKIEVNSIIIHVKQPDDWKKYIIQDMEYKTILINERNKWNKIIEKHKDNMFINGISHDKFCIEMVNDYHELMTGSRRW